MPDQTTDLPEAAIEAAASAVAKMQWDDERRITRWATCSDAARVSLEAAAPILTAPLREELEEAKKERDWAKQNAREAEWRQENGGRHWAKEIGEVREQREEQRARADSAEHRLEEATKALADLIHACPVWMSSGPDTSAAMTRARQFLATLQDSQVDGEGEKPLTLDRLREDDVQLVYEDACERGLPFSDFLLALAEVLAALTPEQPEEGKASAEELERGARELGIEDEAPKNRADVLRAAAEESDDPNVTRRYFDALHATTPEQAAAAFGDDR